MNTGEDRRAWTEIVMGLPVSIHVRGPRARGAGAERAVTDAYASLRNADFVFSGYRPDSVISRLDRGEIDLADCPPEVAEVLELCEAARRRTDGYFDPRPPVGSSSSLRLDPSGLVKGWAARRAAACLSRLDDCDFYLNAGGDILVSSRPGSPGWRIGVEDPRRPGRLLGALALTDGAIATSGVAARGRHIYDPHSGRPVADVLSLTVVGPDLLEADVHATAGVARGAADAISWLATLEHTSALLVAADGSRSATPGFPLQPVAAARDER